MGERDKHLQYQRTIKVSGTMVKTGSYGFTNERLVVSISNILNIDILTLDVNIDFIKTVRYIMNILKRLKSCNYSNSLIPSGIYFVCKIHTSMIGETLKKKKDGCSGQTICR